MDVDPAEAVFGTDSPDLFATLSLEATATLQDVKAAYRRLALRFHPDKLKRDASEVEKTEAKRQFERIGYAYVVLTDENRRKRYEETGRTDERGGFDVPEQGWEAYFKEVWSGEVDAETIETFYEKYRGSKEELDDLKDNYVRFKGHVPSILQSQIGAEYNQEDRLLSRLDDVITSGELKTLQKWTLTRHDKKSKLTRRKQFERESQESNEVLNQNPNLKDQLSGIQSKKKGKSSGEAGLLQMMKQNAQVRKHSMDDLFNKLESKALKEDANESKKSKSKRRRKPVDEEEEECEISPPTLNDDDFEEFQKQMLSNIEKLKSSKKSTSSKNKKPKS